jgi:tetratricopeptide (TPR) repeat protein
MVLTNAFQSYTVDVDDSLSKVCLKYEDLHKFYDQCRIQDSSVNSLTVQQFHAEFVLPALRTAGRVASFSELYFARKERVVMGTNKMYCVVYNPLMPFSELLQSLKRFDSRKNKQCQIRFWIDIFCLRESPDKWQVLGKALKSLAMLQQLQTLVVSPWKHLSVLRQPLTQYLLCVSCWSDNHVDYQPGTLFYHESLEYTTASDHEELDLAENVLRNHDMVVQTMVETVEDSMQDVEVFLATQPPPPSLVSSAQNLLSCLHTSDDINRFYITLEYSIKRLLMPVFRASLSSPLVHALLADVPLTVRESPEILRMRKELTHPTSLQTIHKLYLLQSLRTKTMLDHSVHSSKTNSSRRTNSTSYSCTSSMLSSGSNYCSTAGYVLESPFLDAQQNEQHQQPELSWESKRRIEQSMESYFLRCWKDEETRQKKNNMDPFDTFVFVWIDILAEFYVEKNKLTQAETLLMNGLDLVRKHGTSAHPQSLAWTKRVAQSYESSGRFTLAQLFYHSYLQILREVVHMQSEHLETNGIVNRDSELQLELIQACDQVAYFYFVLDQYQEAEQLYTELVTRCEQRFGHDCTEVVKALSMLSIVSLKLGKLTHADAFSSECLDTCRRLYPDDNSQYVEYEMVRGQVESELLKSRQATCCILEDQSLSDSPPLSAAVGERHRYVNASMRPRSESNSVSCVIC